METLLSSSFIKDGTEEAVVEIQNKKARKDRLESLEYQKEAFIHLGT